MRRHPDEKPPFVDGDLFSSLFEGPQRATAGTPVVSGDRALVPMQFSYAEGGKVTRWTDTVVLRDSPHGWLVDDVRYGGHLAVCVEGYASEFAGRPRLAARQFSRPPQTSGP